MPPEIFKDMFAFAKYISTKFCQLAANFCPFIFANFGRFILVFIKMALILLQILIVLPFQV